MGVKAIGKLYKGDMLVDYNGALYRVGAQSGVVLKAKLQDVNAYLRPGMFVHSDQAERRQAERVIQKHFMDEIEEKE